MPQPEPTVPRRFVWVSTTPTFVHADGGSEVAVQSADNTVYYGPTNTVTTATGTALPAGNTVTLSAGRWFVAASPSRVLVDDAQWVPRDSTHFGGTISVAPVIDTDPGVLFVGDADYTADAQQIGGVVVMAPATRRTFRIAAFQIRAIDGGTLKVINSHATGVVDVSIDSAVTPIPPSLRAIGPGEAIEVDFLGPNQVFVDGGHVVIPTVTPPTNLFAPVITFDGTNFNATSTGTWTGVAAIVSFRRQWQRETSVGSGTFADIAGQTGVLYVYNAGTDANKKIRVKTWATDANGNESAAATSNELTQTSTAVPVNTVAPSILLANGSSPGASVTVGTGVKVDVGTWTGATSYTVEMLNPDNSVPQVYASRGFLTAPDYLYTTITGDAGSVAPYEHILGRVVGVNSVGSSAPVDTAQLSVVPAGGSPPSGGTTFAATVTADMTGAGQTYAASPTNETPTPMNPGYGQAYGPRYGLGSNSLTTNATNIVQNWFVLFERAASQGTVGINGSACKAQVADLQTWVDDVNVGWVMVQHDQVPVLGQMLGAWTTFTGSTAWPSTEWRLPSTADGGGRSFHLGEPGRVRSDSDHGVGWCAHSYPAARKHLFGTGAPVLNTNVRGVVTFCFARLDPADSTTWSTAKYGLCTGCDLNKDVDTAAGIKGDMAIGKVKILDSNWRMFSCSDVRNAVHSVSSIVPVTPPGYSGTGAYR